MLSAYAAKGTNLQNTSVFDMDQHKRSMNLNDLCMYISTKNLNDLCVSATRLND